MFDSILSNPEALGQVIGALIGVAGLVVGTFITILTSFMIRHMDIRREERKENVYLRRAQKEKEFGLKQEIYSAFVTELANLENFISKTDTELELKTIQNFDNEWTKIEIKIELVANQEVKTLKDQLSQELLSLAKKKFAQKDISQKLALSSAYMENRTALLEAIRADMEISPNR